MTDEASAWRHVLNGNRTAYYLDVSENASGSLVRLPVLVARGEREGKTLVVSAGVHGDEFEGMVAIRRLFDKLDPASLFGTFVGVTISNPLAYDAGQRVGRDDGQDMARIFPGDPLGTVTEQLAYTLTHRFIRHADLYCDLHSAGQYYAMPPLVGYQMRPEPLLTRQRDAARAFGMPIIWGTPALPGRSLSAAGEHNVPAIYAEITGEGRCRAADVDAYVNGLRRLLSHLGMSDAAPPAEPPNYVVETHKAGAGHLQIQNRAPRAGYFETAVGLTERVESGQKIGLLRNALGEVIHVAEATCAGIVVLLRTFPRVRSGDALCTIMETD